MEVKLKNNDYHISFFKPTTVLAKKNRNIIVLLISIWFTGIFGFHILLKIVEKPTPEKDLSVFENSWIKVKSDNVKSEENFVALANSLLSVLGKSTITAEDRSVLDKVLNWCVYNLIPEDRKEEIINDVRMLNKIQKNLNSLKDTEYLKYKEIIISKVGSLMKLNAYSIKAKILPIELVANEMKPDLNINDDQVSDIMKLYLTHNQSFLTDARFLGFPFHYFYTAVFLLILFVVLCLLYCIRIDRLHKKLNIQESV